MLLSVIKTSLFVVYLLAFAGCTLHAYRLSPEDHRTNGPLYASQKNRTIYYNLPQLSAESGNDPMRRIVNIPAWASFLEKNLVQNPTFDHAVRTSSPPEKGTYVSITVTGQAYLNLTLPSAVSLILSACTLFILPAYAENSGEFIVRYNLFLDGMPIKEYTHRVQRKTLIWWFTDLTQPFWLDPPWDFPQEKVLAGTAHLFWLDGDKDHLF